MSATAKLPDISRQPESKSSRLWVLLVCVAAMVLAAIAAWHRVPWDDEGEFSNAAWNLAKHGFLGTTVLDSPVHHLPHIGQRTYWVMPLYLLGQAGWYLIAPGTLFWTRVFTIIWIPVALYAFSRFLGNLGPIARRRWLLSAFSA